MPLHRQKFRRAAPPSTVRHRERPDTLLLRPHPSHRPQRNKYRRRNRRACPDRPRPRLHPSRPLQQNKYRQRSHPACLGVPIPRQHLSHRQRQSRYSRSSNRARPLPGKQPLNRRASRSRPGRMCRLAASRAHHPHSKDNCRAAHHPSPIRTDTDIRRPPRRLRVSAGSPADPVSIAPVLAARNLPSPRTAPVRVASTT